MVESLLGLACEKASNAFLFSMFYECAEGRRKTDDCVIAGLKRAREYVELANKLGTALTKRGEDHSFDIKELDAYLELSEALAVDKGKRVSLLDNETFNLETSFLVQALDDLENKRELVGERKQKAIDLFAKLSGYFSRKFHEARESRCGEEDD